MSRLVVLSLGQGSLEEGFPAVIVQFGEAGSAYSMKLTASLPAAPEISEIYRKWRSLYSAFYQRLRFRDAVVNEDDDFEIEEAYITNVSEIDIHDLCQRMSFTINKWLNSNDFRRIEQQLRTQLKPTDEIRFIIETNDNLMRRIPWHLWNFFEDYLQAEIALSAVEYQKLPKNLANTHKNKIKILAIFGDSSGININQDRKFLQQLSHEADIQFLVEPQLSDLNDFLWQQGWDILFFAGHGVVEEEGLIQINHTHRISIERLKYALKKAITGGLRLAIFNSCDSLNLAQQLQDLQIPQMIVMREPIPDTVAQEFLKYFLAAFSGGQSLYASVRIARLRLQSLEDEFPCATWLPVLCHNPAEELMGWQMTPEITSEFTPEINQLIETEFSPQISSHISPDKENHEKLVSQKIQNTPSEQENKTVLKQTTQWKYRKIGFKKSNKLTFFKVLLSSILVAAFWIGIRHWGLIQSFELQSFDHLMNLRPFQQQDSRLLLITVDEKDIEYQHNNNMTMQGSLSDQALLQLLQKLDLYKPRAIGLDIYRDFPVNPQFSQLINHYGEDTNLFSVCKVPAPSDGAPDEIAPPSGFPKERVSFSDFVADSDDTVRRQLLSLTPPTISRCVANKAFSFILAMHYLDSLGYKYTFNSQGNLQIYNQINNIILKQLTSHTSGYQYVDASGYQILLNYRSLASQEEIATQIPLREILQENVDSEIINSLKNRIVLIGVTAASTSDIWKTPFNNYLKNTEKIPGIFLQAQMVSQIVSAVLDKRHLLWWFPEWMEITWIWAWSFYGAMIGWGVNKILHLAAITTTAILTLFAICFILFTQGGWVPLIPSSLVLFSSILLIKLNYYNDNIYKPIDRNSFYEHTLVRKLSNNSHFHKYKTQK
jgi:CHASE2 domain-containing sensor protein